MAATAAAARKTRAQPNYARLAVRSLLCPTAIALLHEVLWTTMLEGRGSHARLRQGDDDEAPPLRVFRWVCMAPCDRADGVGIQAKSRPVHRSLRFWPGRPRRVLLRGSRMLHLPPLRPSTRQSGARPWLRWQPIPHKGGGMAARNALAAPETHARGCQLSRFAAGGLWS